jgi:hypothetical protein
MTKENSIPRSQRAASVRTALMLAVVAALSFGAIIVAQRLGTSPIWLGMLGVAVIGFALAAMVGRRRAR